MTTRALYVDGVWIPYWIEDGTARFWDRGYSDPAIATSAVEAAWFRDRRVSGGVPVEGELLAAAVAAAAGQRLHGDE